MRHCRRNKSKAERKGEQREMGRKIGEFWEGCLVGLRSKRVGRMGGCEERDFVRVSGFGLLQLPQRSSRK